MGSIDHVDRSKMLSAVYRDQGLRHCMGFAHKPEAEQRPKVSEAASLDEEFAGDHPDEDADRGSIVTYPIPRRAVRL